MRAAHVGGALWSLTTNPLRGATGRARAFTNNLAAFERACAQPAPASSSCATPPGIAAHAPPASTRRSSPCRAATRSTATPKRCLCSRTDAVVAVTLMHLSRSRLGSSSSPLSRGRGGLSAAGREYVQRLNAMRVFVDLGAHHARGFLRRRRSARPHSAAAVLAHGRLRRFTPLAQHRRRADARGRRHRRRDRGDLPRRLPRRRLLGRRQRGADRRPPRAHRRYRGRRLTRRSAAIGTAPSSRRATCRRASSYRVWSSTCSTAGSAPQRMQKILGGNFLRALTYVARLTQSAVTRMTPCCRVVRVRGPRSITIAKRLCFRTKSCF